VRYEVAVMHEKAEVEKMIYGTKILPLLRLKTAT
jgi:hypothetical protein